MSRPFSREWMLYSFACGRQTGLGSIVSPFSLIFLYLAAPTSNSCQYPRCNRDMSRKANLVEMGTLLRQVNQHVV